MANPIRESFVSKPEAARVVLVDTVGDIYKASGGGAGSDVNIDSIGGNPVTTTIPVSGTVSVTEPVSVDDNGGSLTVDGPLTDAELRATPVPVSGTVSVNEPVTVDATDLDIRNLVAATDSVAIHGDVGVVDQLDLTNTNPLAVAIVDGSGDQITSFGGGTQYNQGTATTDTDVLTMAGAVRRDTAAVASGVADGDRLALSTDNVGQLRVAPPADVTASGTIDADEETVTLELQGRSGVSIQYIDSSFIGSLFVEISADGGTTWDVTWFWIPASMFHDFQLVDIVGSAEIVMVPWISGITHVRVRADEYTSGSAAISIRATANESTGAIPAADVSTGTPSPIQLGLLVREVARGQNTMAASIPVVIASNQSAVPVSGTVTVGTITAGDNIIGRVKVTDGTDLALVTAAGEQNVLATAQPGVDIGDVTINNAAGASAVNIQDGGNTITVDGTVTVGTITAGDNIIGRVKITDGTDLALVTAAGEQNVIATAQPGVDIGDVTINNAAGASAVNIQDGGNTITVDGTVSVNLNAGTNTNEVVGDVAADAPAAGNPVLIAASSETMADSAPANRVSQDADATRLSATDGALFVITTGPQTFQFIATGVQTGAQVHASPGTGLSLYITDITFSINSATASSIKVLNNGGADIWGPHYLEAIAGRGLAVHFTTPLKVTAATRLDVTTTGAATQTTNIQGFIAPG